MHTLFHPDTVKIESIDLTEHRYFLSPWEKIVPEDTLLKSIRRFGILHPPLVQLQGEKCIVVSGWKRILAAGQISSGGSIFCLVIPEETPESIIYELLVEDAVSGSGMSVVEQAMLLKKFLKVKPADAALPLLERLGHKPNVHTIEALTSVLALHKKTISAVHRGIIPLKTAQKMLQVSAPDQEILTRIITSLQLGGSKQNKLIEYSIEMGKRTDLPLDDLFEDFFKDRDFKQEENIPQRAAALLHWLQQKCFPGITKAEEDFRQSIAAMKLPQHLRLDHTVSFEDERITLSVQFPDMKTVRKKIPNIIKITDT